MTDLDRYAEGAYEAYARTLRTWSDIDGPAWGDLGDLGRLAWLNAAYRVLGMEAEDRQAANREALDRAVLNRAANRAGPDRT